MRESGGGDPEVVGADQSAAGLEVAKELAVVPSDFTGPFEHGKGLAKAFPIPAGGGRLSAREFAYDCEGERETVVFVTTQKGMGGAGGFAASLAFEGDDKIGVEDQFHGFSGG